MTAHLGYFRCPLVLLLEELFESSFLDMCTTVVVMLNILNSSVDYFPRTEQEFRASLMCEVRRC
jgi:hypothetical protein